MSPDVARSDTRAASAEAKLLSQVREQYESQGYQASTTLPVEQQGSLSGYRPDLVLKKGSEVVVIELKRPAETRDAEGLKRLRSEIEKHPGWHFRVLYAGDPFQAPPMAVKFSSSKARTLSDVPGRLASARKLLQHGDNVG